MTREEILVLKPGRDRNLLIRTKILGHDMTGFEWPKHGGKSMVKVTPTEVIWQEVKPYSTEASVALELLEAIKDKFDVVSLIYCNGSWECGFTPLNSLETGASDFRYDAPDLAEAITTAVLLTALEPDPEDRSLPFADEDVLEVDSE